MTDTFGPSIVIPAHDEADTIEACLDSIEAEGDFETVVVCNGCTDATATIARRHHPRVRVLELPTAHKPTALNTGDQVVHGFPRVYVDADVIFEPGALRALLAALHDDVLAAAPVPEITDDDCPSMVRSYYAIWRRLGVIDSSLCGSGVYAMSREGRARFGAFPNVVADDLFVDQRFGSTERAMVYPGVSYHAPMSTRALVHRKTRGFAGNIELAREGFSGHVARRTSRRWFQVVAHDRALWAHVPAFVAISAVAKVHAHVAVWTAAPLWVDR